MPASLPASSVRVPPYSRETAERQMADLAAARARATFDPEKMTEVIYDPETRRKRAQALEIVQNEEMLVKLIDDWPFLGDFERRQRTWPAMKRLAEIQLGRGLSPDDMLYVLNLLGVLTPLFNHQQSFQAANLTSHASDEQLAHWGPLGESFRFWGSFAQTELGHGSAVSDIETTATYDPAAQEFVLDTPTLSSTKWWIGALGTYATHSLVMAQLIVGGQRKGIAPFLFQVRNMDTHEPLPGIYVGEIGPKLGPVENGWLRLDKVRVPLSSLLSRNLRVLPDGTFLRPKDSKLLLGGMLVRRTEITASSARALAKACTVGVRYCEVRRQNKGVGEEAKKGGEAAVMGYPMVKMRILPALAAAYSFAFVGKYLVGLLNGYRTRMMAGDEGAAGMLNDFHPTLSGLKAYCTTTAADGIEDIRRCLGGHGYSHASGLGLLYAQWSVFTTAEGEAVLMTQQTARYLARLAGELKKGGGEGKVKGNVGTAYLATLWEEEAPCAARNPAEFANPAMQVALFAHRARRQVRELVAALDASHGELGLCAAQAFAASTAHTQHLIVAVMWNKVDELRREGTDGKVVEVLGKLAALNGAFLLAKHFGEWLEDGHLDGAQIKVVRQLVHDINDAVRPEAAALVDAWQFSDLELQSQLGRADGNAYEGMFLWALRDPVNKGMGGKAVFDGYGEFLRPLITGEVAAEARRARDGPKL
ncbi:acyl-CoA dehydrogenase/oxidase [Hyaloraphidium curvatum]|nr:acyl-CoA dehydrogenase/oxidase [Hyaloraphidium curvatum]